MITIDPSIDLTDVYKPINTNSTAYAFQVTLGNAKVVFSDSGVPADNVAFKRMALSDMLNANIIQGLAYAKRANPLTPAQITLTE